MEYAFHIRWNWFPTAEVYLLVRERGLSACIILTNEIHKLPVSTKKWNTNYPKAHEQCGFDKPQNQRNKGFFNNRMCPLLTEIIPVCTYQYWSAQLFGKPWDNTFLTDLPAQQCFRGFWHGEFREHLWSQALFHYFKELKHQLNSTLTYLV